MRIVSRLLTNVALVCGTAGAGTTRLTSAGLKLGNLSVPALSVSAEGALVLSRVVVPSQRIAVAVSGGPGAFYILHMAGQGASGSGAGDGRGGSSWTPPPGGPGKWVRKNEGMKPRARKYQSQVTGAPEGWVYTVERGGEKFDFDGYQDGYLLDAKGPNYDNKFLDTLEPEPWFKNTGAQEILEGAQRQLRMADGIPIRWYVAEAKTARALRKLFEREGLDAIEVIHLPALP